MQQFKTDRQARLRYPDYLEAAMSLEELTKKFLSHLTPEEALNKLSPAQRQAAEARGEAKGEAKGRQEGEEEALRRMAATFCELHQIPLTAKRKSAIQSMSIAALNRLLTQLMQTHAWPNTRA